MRKVLLLKFLIILLFQIVFFTTANSQKQAERGFGNKAQTAKRVALVIGNSDYKGTDNDLPNPINDATDVAAKLRGLDFEIVSGNNLTKLEMRQKIREFVNKLNEQKALGVFFYAGHGISIAGQNYLIPVDADPYSEDEVDKDADSLDFLMDKLRTAENPLNIVILDACRNNPFSRRWNKSRTSGVEGGLAKITAPQGALIFYSTSPGKVADDGNQVSRNSPFTSALLNHISTPELTYDEFTTNVALEVWEKTNQKQFPWKEGIDTYKFKFVTSNSEKSSSTSQAIQTLLGNKQFIRPSEDSLKQSDKITQFGEALRARDDCQTAIPNFTEALSYNPESDTAYSRRGECYRVLGEYQKAVEDLDNAIRKNPNNHFAYASRGAVYWSLDQTDRAVKDLSQAILLSNKFYWAYLTRGELYLQLGKALEALKDLNSAISIKPGEEYPYLVRSRTYLSQNNLDKAWSDLNTLLDINPISIDALEERMFVAMRRSDFNKALQDSLKLIQINPQESEGYYFFRAILFAQRYSFADAIREINSAINLNGEGKIMAIIFRGMFYAASENKAQALADFNQAIGVSKKSYEIVMAYGFRAMYYAIEDEHKKALSDIEFGFKVNIEDKEVEPFLKSLLYFLRAGVQASKKKYEAALSDINLAIQLFPNNGFYYSLRSEIYRNLGKLKEGAEDERKAGELNQNQQFIWK